MGRRQTREDEIVTEIYGSHFERILRRVYRVVRCPADAADLTQEAFLRWVVKLRGRYHLDEHNEHNEHNEHWGPNEHGRSGYAQHSPAANLGLLYRIGHGLAIDAVRRQAVTRRLMAMQPPVDLAPDSEAITIAKDDARRAQDALATVSPRATAAFMMRREEGMTFAEIGASLGVSAPRAHQLAAEAM
ncbi:MAG: RNA polymerase sigma factor, partial [Pseudomonadota bacterium]